MGFLDGLGWAAFTIIKFALTPSLMIGNDYTFWETWVLTAISASVGVTLFYFFGTGIFAWIDSKRKKKKVVFSKKSRRLVRFLNSYGLIGLGVSSVVLSVPIAGVLASKFFRKPRVALPVLWIAFTAWAFILTYVSETGLAFFNG